MNDIVPELLEKIREDFFKDINSNPAMMRMAELIKSGTATYKDLNNYSVWSGQTLSFYLKKHITADVLPDGRMYYNIADRILGETLKDNHELVSTAVEAVQKNLNKSAGIGIKAIKPPLDKDKIKGLVDKISNEADFEKVSWLLDEPIVTNSQSIVEEGIKLNASFQSRLGLRATIVRTAEAGACKWCRNLEGVYQYPDVPDDVYHRHERCRCVVEYNPKDGKKINVWTKK